MDWFIVATSSVASAIPSHCTTTISFFFLNLKKRLMYVGVFHSSLLYDWPWKIEEVVMIWLCCLSGTLKAQKCPSRSTATDIDIRYKKPFLFIISNGSAYFCWSMSWIQWYSQYWYMYMYIHTLHQKVYIKLFKEQTENVGPLRALRARLPYMAPLCSQFVDRLEHTCGPKVQ